LEKLQSLGICCISLISLQSRGRWLFEGVDVLLMDIIERDGMGQSWSFAGGVSAFSPLLLSWRKKMESSAMGNLIPVACWVSAY
jgi:hypothetical protein